MTTKKPLDAHHGKAGAFVIRDGKRVPDERAAVTSLTPPPAVAPTPTPAAAAAPKAPTPPPVKAEPAKPASKE